MATHAAALRVQQALRIQTQPASSRIILSERVCLHRCISAARQRASNQIQRLSRAACRLHASAPDSPPANLATATEDHSSEHHSLGSCDRGGTQRRIAAVRLLSAAHLLLPAAAFAAGGTADDVVAYDAAAGSETIKNVFGAGYVLLVAFFAIRLLSKRAKRAKTERLASSADEGAAGGSQQEPLPSTSPAERPSPFSALYGAAQAAFLATILWTLTTNVSGYFDAKVMPDNYTARNISVAVKTIVEGLAYLLTFLFGANALGLVALAGQLALFPDLPLEPDEMKRGKDPNALPKVALTDDIFAIRKAFEEVQNSSGSGSSRNSGNDKK